MIGHAIYSVYDQTLMIKRNFYGTNLSIHIFNIETNDLVMRFIPYMTKH